MRRSKYLKQKQIGFTLIELMFVIVIVAILATISIPTYQDFSSKTQIHIAYQDLSRLKAPTSLKLLNNETISSATSLGWITGSSPLLSNDPIVSIDSSTASISLEVTLDGKVFPVAKGVKIRLVRSPHGHWSCTIKKSTNNAWKDSFAPKTCQII